MTDVVSMPPQHYEHPLRRRISVPSSIVVAPPELNFLNHYSSSATSATRTTSTWCDDLELLWKKPNSNGYTSLKDLLPTASVNSPRPSSAAHGQGGSGICIRNRLVKQAAWAYLQPMSNSPGSADGVFLRRIWLRLAALFDLVSRGAARILDWMLGSVIATASPSVFSGRAEPGVTLKDSDLGVVPGGTTCAFFFSESFFLKIPAEGVSGAAVPASLFSSCNRFNSPVAGNIPMRQN